MRGTTCSPLTVATILLLMPTSFAANSKVLPCALGNGAETPCDSCDESKAIEVTPWSSATWDKDFTMPEAASQSGPGYDVYWKIEQPAEGCRILLFESFNSAKGSIEPKMPGKIMLSVNSEGCFMATVGTRGVAAGYCCGDECRNIGAVPGAAPGRVRRTIPPPPSRVMRSMLATRRELQDIDAEARDKVDVQGKEDTQNIHRSEPKIARGGGRQNPDTTRPGPSPKAPVWNCKAEKVGPSYSKSGKQQVDGKTFTCRTLGCDMSVDFSTTVATTVSSEKSTTFTNSEGFSIDVTLGWMYIGPTATTTLGYNKEFSEAISSSMGNAQTNTKSKSVSWRQQVLPGATYNGWWAATLKCQMYNFTCNDGKEQAPMEQCGPDTYGDDELIGEQGIMTTGGP